MNKLRQTAAGGGRLLSLIALAIILLGFATPAHADSISIDLDATAVTLQRSGNLYEHTSSLHVHNSNTYGFTLSMNASQPNLVNSKDSTYKIDSVSGTNQKLAANQWGYGMGKNATTFSSVSSASLADITSGNKGSCTSADDCTFYLTLGANIDPKRLPVGSYSTSLTYTATSKPAPVQPSTPSSGGSSSGGSSYDAWWSICYGRYPSDNDKRSYCYIHNGDMSGYWNEECHKNYSYDSDKESYCKAHDGDMSGYQPDWGSICSSRYPDNDPETNDKWLYCNRHQGDMSGYQPNWGSICRNRYPGSDTDSSNKRTYCAEHKGSMSGYLDWLCGGLYSGDNNKLSYCKAHNGGMSGYLDWLCGGLYSGDNYKISYCKDHNGDMSGYEDYYWDNTCSTEYIFEDNKIAYCKDHHGNMSGYLDWLCGGWYPGNDDETVFVKRPYCIAHDGDMSGYRTPSHDDICRAKYPGNDSYSMDERLACISSH